MSLPPKQGSFPCGVPLSFSEMGSLKESTHPFEVIDGSDTVGLQSQWIEKQTIDRGYISQ